MCADFAKAIFTVLKHEGGYCDHPLDSGGATNCGISQKYLSKKYNRQVSDDEMKSLTRDEIIAIYKADFWLPVYAAIQSQVIATKIFDVCVNMGQYHGHCILQKALNDLPTLPALSIDGKIGLKTLAAINLANPEKLLDAIINRQVERYESIVANNPSQKIWLDNWLKRAKWPRRESENDNERTT